MRREAPLELEKVLTDACSLCYDTGVHTPEPRVVPSDQREGGTVAELKA